MELFVWFGGWSVDCYLEFEVEVMFWRRVVMVLGLYEEYDFGWFCKEW